MFRTLILNDVSLVKERKGYALKFEAIFKDKKAHFVLAGTELEQCNIVFMEGEQEVFIERLKDIFGFAPYDAERVKSIFEKNKVIDLYEK